MKNKETRAERKARKQAEKEAKKAQKMQSRMGYVFEQTLTQYLRILGVKPLKDKPVEAEEVKPDV